MTKIIKSIAYSLALVTTLGTLASCKDLSLLDETVYSELTESNAFSTSNDATAAVNAIYAPLISVTSSYIFSLNDLTTDDCFKSETDFELLNDGKMSSNSDVSNTWTNLYSIAGRANIAIDKIPGIALSEFGTDQTAGAVLKNRLIAEAYFMRGFAYYNLSDFYYTVPLVTSSSTAVDAILPLAGIDDIETQIDADLTAAVANLPKKYDSNDNAGRATYGAAVGYLCRLHMRKAGRMRLAGKDATEEWNKALVYANDILSLEGSVYNLQSKVWNIFDPTSDASLYNNELIFAVHANANSVNGTSDIGMRFTPWLYDCGWDIFSLPLEMVWKFDKSDERYTKLIVTQYPSIYNSALTYVIPPAIEQTGSMYKANDPSYQYELSAAYTQKYKYTKALTYNYNTGNNMILLRLADIILCKAEILNELNGPTQETINLINRIRERAFQNSDHNLKLSDYSTKEALRSAICDERMFELNNEGVRRPDLIRMGLWKDRMDKYIAGIKQKSIYKEDNALKSSTTGVRPDYSSMWKVYPSDLTENDVRRYFPAPKRELDLNPALSNNRKFTN